jgi:hypothetical protein
MKSDTDLAVIAMWLGHSSTADRAQPAATPFQPGGRLLAFLEGL